MAALTGPRLRHIWHLYGLVLIIVCNAVWTLHTTKNIDLTESVQHRAA